MKHPTQAQWLDFAYGEIKEPQRLELEAHLAVCPDCARQLNEWRRTGQQLDAWRVDVSPTREVNARRWPWAAAAAIALLLGVTAGHWSINPADLRVQIATELRAEFDQKLNVTTAQWLLARQQDQQVTLDLLKQVEARRVAEDTSLRKSLETVAVLTQSGFQQANYQMRSLASRAEPAAVPAAYRPN